MLVEKETKGEGTIPQRGREILGDEDVAALLMSPSLV